MTTEESTVTTCPDCGYVSGHSWLCPRAAKPDDSMDDRIAQLERDLADVRGENAMLRAELANTKALAAERIDALSHEVARLRRISIDAWNHAHDPGMG